MRRISLLMLVGTVSVAAGACAPLRGPDRDSERANEKMQRETDKRREDATGVTQGGSRVDQTERS